MNLQEAQALIEKLQKENIALQNAVSRLEHQLALFKKEIFGPKSEKKPSDLSDEESVQQELFEEQSENKTVFAIETEKESITYERAKKGHGRNKIPEYIRRKEVIVDIEESEKICPCCKNKKEKIGEDTSEELAYQPAKVYVIKRIFPKYVCRKCPDQKVERAAAPIRIIPRGLAGATLLAYILTSKYVWHLPLYRQEKMFKHYGIEINRSTMCLWEAEILPYLERLYEALIQKILQSRYLQTDETHLKVKVPDVAGKCHRGFLWPFTDGKVIVFNYSDGRSKETPKNFLSGYKGYLQSDGYAVYANITNTDSNIIHLECMAHARRKFIESEKQDPKLVKIVICILQKLYRIEKKCRDVKNTLDEETYYQYRYKQRNAHAPIYFKRLYRILQVGKQRHTPKNPLYKAIEYMENRFDELQVYLQDGILEIDNNRIENGIRPVALGRKNWLFAGSEDGAEKLAIMYSLVNTCKMNDIDVYEYFADVLSRIPEHPMSKIHELLPLEWKQNRSVLVQE